MKINVLACFTLLLMSVLPSYAQETPVRTVAFNAYSFTYPASLAESVRITTYDGDPLDQPAPTMAGFEPPYAEIQLYNEWNYRPELTIRFIETANLAGYPDESVLEDLQNLLATQPDLQPLEQIVTTAPDHALPAPPPRGAAQILIARADYIETETLIGIRYLTVYAQDMYPLNAESFRYVFLGVTKDDSTYISMETFLYTDLFADPTLITQDELDVFYQDPDSNYQQGIETVDAAPVEAFTPFLDELDAIIASIQITPDQ